MSIEILASKFRDVMGTYKRLLHTILVLSFGKCVLKAEVNTWPVKLYVRFLKVF